MLARIKHQPGVRMFWRVAVCLVALLAAQPPGRAGGSPGSDNYYGTLVADGWWMRPFDATYLEWTFRNLEPSRFSGGITVNLRLMVTNQVNGGSGYSTAVRVRVRDPITSTGLAFENVWLQDTLPGVFTVSQIPPIIANTQTQYTMGYGYQTSGSIVVPPTLISSSGTLVVRVERCPDLFNFPKLVDRSDQHPRVVGAQ